MGRRSLLGFPDTANIFQKRRAEDFTYEATDGAKCIEITLLRLESNDNPLIVNVLLSQTRTPMQSKKKRIMTPASFGTPRDMQQTRTGEGTPSEAEDFRNDGTRPNPLGSLGFEKNVRNSGEPRPKGKHRRKLSNLVL